MSGVSEREDHIRAYWSELGALDERLLSVRERHVRDLIQLLDAERERSRVLAAAVPDDPWSRAGWAKNCYSCRRFASDLEIESAKDVSVGHKPDCKWLAAQPIKEEVERGS